MNRSRREILKAGLLSSVALAARGEQPVKRSSAPGAGRRAKLALALGSGSLHGHALVGVMRAFEAAGVRPDLIVGTSVGAIVGALWASGLDSEAIGRAAARITLWHNARLAWPKRGLFSNRGLQETIRELTGGRPIESWPMRFAAVASDQATGERIVIDRGDAGMAVAASASMPVLCEPVAWNDRIFYKGCMLSGMPNFAMVIVYANASATLRSEIVARYICRVLRHLDQTGATVATPTPPPGIAATDEPLLGLQSGYLLRSMHLMPRNGTARPWRLDHDYLLDRAELPVMPIEDGSLVFSDAEQAAEEPQLEAAE